MGLGHSQLVPRTASGCLSLSVGTLSVPTDIPLKGPSLKGAKTYCQPDIFSAQNGSLANHLDTLG